MGGGAQGKTSSLITGFFFYGISSDDTIITLGADLSDCPKRCNGSEPRLSDRPTSAEITVVEPRAHRKGMARIVFQSGAGSANLLRVARPGLGAAGVTEPVKLAGDRFFFVHRKETTRCLRKKTSRGDVRPRYITSRKLVFHFEYFGVFFS